MPADASGTWKIQLDIFPGWDEELWPDDYYLYGSGAYELDLSIGGTVEAPETPLPQPEIFPVAQTFIINDDPTGNADEYSYLAAVPAANYLEDGKRYVSPIVYQGVDYIPTWFTTVDQTTQYLLDDWNTYLSRHDMTAEENILTNDPVNDAANIATSQWDTADTVVIAVDGSSFEDSIETLVDEDRTLTSSPEVEEIAPSDFINIGGSSAKLMYLSQRSANFIINDDSILNSLKKTFVFIEPSFL